MARNIKAKNGDGPEFESTDLELNLAFCSTRDLITELFKRCNCAVVAYQLTDVMMESEPAEDDKERTEGGMWTATSYTGNIAHCIGLSVIMKHDLLKVWE